MVAAKTSMKDYNINALDLCLFRTFSAFLTSLGIALVLKIPFSVEKKH
jgi:hypothetical protein